MSLYGLLALQFCICAVVVAVGLRTVRQTRNEIEANIARRAKRDEEHKRFLAQLQEAAAHPELPVSQFVTAWAKPSVLRLTLDLTDPDLVVDVGRLARDSERLLAGLGEYEVKLGGRGLIFTEAKAAPGQVVFTLTPADLNGADLRIKEVAEALNATFDPLTRRREQLPSFGSLPAEVSGAHASPLAA
ncbi:hypothetical protein R5W23_001019 [Gemmata sp. JC673]|uniref:Uncharacterized protein n=1 Tax=Gemmata algarum TaxID=2975278 RepID=A0ABU5EZD0_9BACT|nr:hypothetical protein [Gemmata algarum]MDY3559847.1 hypothetical protein [Gemmata algarum]